MTNNEQPSPDQTGTWEPDMERLSRIVEWELKIQSTAIAEKVGNDLRRQQAAQGKVEVPWEFLVTMRNITEKYPPDGSIEMVTEVLTNLIDRHEGALAAAKDQQEEEPERILDDIDELGAERIDVWS